MAASYSTSIKIFSNRTDFLDDVLATDINQAYDEITAIQTALGADLAFVRNLPDGTMINGKIAVSVATNDLTLALKTYAGTDPSATDTVFVKINGTWRTVTSALSVTKNDATNWCNAGSAELATKEIDYFAYLIWNTGAAPDVVDIGFSRIPYGRLYSDFSTTTTSEKYLAYGNASAPNSGDDCAVVGRFAATLSAGAGYTWTVPTFTSENLIQAPIYRTRWLSYQPAYSASGSMTWTSVTTTFAKYMLDSRTCLVQGLASGTTGGTASVALSATLPFESRTASVTGWGNVSDGGGGLSASFSISAATPDTINGRRYDSANYGLGAARSMGFNALYEIE